MIIKWPDAKDDLWQEYNMIRVTEMRDIEAAGKSSTLKNPKRSTWNTGKRWTWEQKVYWEQRKLQEDVSALQHAMNLWFERCDNLSCRIPKTNP